jgi:hypothetical protein
MKTFSCEVVLTAAEFEQFNRTICGSRLGHDRLDELLSTALSEKYTPDELMQLTQSRGTPGFQSTYFNVREVRNVDDGSPIVTYAYDVPVRMRSVTRIYDEERDAGNLAEGDLLSTMPLFCPFDARAGAMVHAMRRKNKILPDEANDPVGVSRHDRIRVVISSVPDDR